MPGRRLIITCEHAANRIPLKYKFLFKGKKEVKSHLGWDPGAFDLGKYLASKMNTKYFFQPYSRLLIECNRSPDHYQLYSEFTRNLPTRAKADIFDNYYSPYRSKVGKEISQLILSGNKVLHLSVHSFTPTLDGVERKADVGILFDPSRKEEKIFSVSLKQKLQEVNLNLRVRFNYPYLGIDDGFTSWFRRKYLDKDYLGIELEINQNIIKGIFLKKIQATLLKALRKTYFIAH